MRYLRVGTRPVACYTCVMTHLPHTPLRDEARFVFYALDGPILFQMDVQYPGVRENTALKVDGQFVYFAEAFRERAGAGLFLSRRFASTIDVSFKYIYVRRRDR